jgi:hypothetical protein
MKNKHCDCLEIYKTDTEKYSFISDWHDCQYIKERNKLIVQAESYAVTNATSPSGKLDGDKFTRLFSIEMDRLAKETKLV